MDQKIVLLSKTRTFLCDPKLLSGSVYINTRNKIHKNGAIYREYQINVQGYEVFEVDMHMKAR